METPPETFVPRIFVRRIIPTRFKRVGVRDDEPVASISRLPNLSFLMTNNPVLRHMRESAMLSQIELGRLIEVSQARISRYESGEEYPPLSVALAYYAIFGRPPHHCFPELYSNVEDAVMRKAAELETELRVRHDRASTKKRALLERMMSRACNRASA